jgi:tripartite-type tricarboxylate transporter receptor subunit TctC
VGGPDQQDKFPDIRNDYQRSEVALDFNAGFTSAAAGLAALNAQRKTRTCSNTGTGAAQWLLARCHAEYVAVCMRRPRWAHQGLRTLY